MPQERKTTLKSPLETHVKRDLAKRPDLAVITIAYGAKYNWTFFDNTFSSAIKVLDFYHAAEHLKKTIVIDVVYKDSDEATAVFRQQRSKLRHDPTGVGKVIVFWTQNPISKPVTLSFSR